MDLFNLFSLIAAAFSGATMGSFLLVTLLYSALLKAAFMLAIIAASYVFNHAHILKGLTKTCNENYQVVNFNNYRALSSLQNLMHLGQFTAAGYVIYLLAIQNLAITS